MELNHREKSSSKVAKRAKAKPLVKAARPLKVIKCHVVAFYEYKDKKGKLHKLASVSNVLPLKIYAKKPAKSLIAPKH